MSIPFDSISATATKVRELHENHRKASSMLADRELMVLGRLIIAVAPALSALGSKIPVKSVTAPSERTATKVVWSTTKGVRVRGSGPFEEHSRADTGAIAGEDLWLLTDQSWCRVTYTGTWCRRQGGTSQWEAQCGPISDSEVVEEYSLDDIASSLLASLVAHRDGSLERRTKAMNRRIEMIDAMLRLLALG